jgi:hypothetical protein
MGASSELEAPPEVDTMRCWMWLLTALLCAASRPALAELIITAAESGPDVVFSGSGTLNISDLTFVGNANLLAGIDFGAEVLLGADPSGFPAVEGYGIANEITLPGVFGADLFTSANLGTGPRVGVAVSAFSMQTAPAIVVPAGYVSGAPLSSTSTFSGKSLSSLRINPGTYTWSWGSGENADSLTLQIVPEPRTVLLLALVLTSLCAGRSRRFAAEAREGLVRGSR